MKPILKTAERIAVVLGIALAFFAVLETLQAWQTLRDLHPWAGHAFLLVVALLLLYLLLQLRALLQYRAALKPPALPAEGPLHVREVKQALRYLDRVTARLSENSILKDDGAQEELKLLESEVAMLINQAPSPDDARKELHRIENLFIAPLLDRLDKHAEVIVSDNVGLVTLGTALSPYKSIDLYIVLARNIRMVNRILHVYRTRPTLRETVKVFYDIARVVAAVNLLNAMDNVWAGIGRHIPKVGTLAEAVSEGMFSGLLTSVAGHAAIDRSRSYQPWSGEEAARRYQGRLNRWARDVLGILVRYGFDRIIPGRGSRSSKSKQAFEDLDEADESGKTSRRWWKKKSE
jgi:uncharacterized membrane protein YcjF (UPF0283 family)